MKVKEVLGHGDPWGDGMVTWDVETDEGQFGKLFRKVGNEVTPGMEVTPNGQDKQGNTKFKLVTGYGGGGSFNSTGGGGNYSAPKKGNAEFRTPDQIIRSTALECAVAAGANDTLNVAAQFAKWITDGPAPAAEPEF